MINNISLPRQVLYNSHSLTRGQWVCPYCIPEKSETERKGEQRRGRNGDWSIDSVRQRSREPERRTTTDQMQLTMPVLLRLPRWPGDCSFGRRWCVATAPSQWWTIYIAALLCPAYSKSWIVSVTTDACSIRYYLHQYLLAILGMLSKQKGSGRHDSKKANRQPTKVLKHSTISSQISNTSLDRPNYVQVQSEGSVQNSKRKWYNTL